MDPCHLGDQTASTGEKMNKCDPNRLQAAACRCRPTLWTGATTLSYLCSCNRHIETLGIQEPHVVLGVPLQPLCAAAANGYHHNALLLPLIILHSSHPHIPQFPMTQLLSNLDHLTAVWADDPDAASVGIDAWACRHKTGNQLQEKSCTHFGMQQTKIVLNSSGSCSCVCVSGIFIVPPPV